MQNATATMKEVVNVGLSKDRHDELKAAAVERGMKLKEYVELRLTIADEASPEALKRGLAKFSARRREAQ